MTAPLKDRLQPLFDWLIDGAPGTLSPPVVVGRIGRELRAGGVAVERVTAFVRTLHPHIAGRRFMWTPELEDAKVSELPWGGLNSPEFVNNPIRSVFDDGREIHVPLHGS